jgi:hypothetical protein
MTTASVKLTADEMFQLRHDAKAKRMTISDYLRAAIAKMNPAQRARQCKVTGRPGRVIIVHPPGTPPITDAMRRAAEEEYDLEAAG